MSTTDDQLQNTEKREVTTEVEETKCGSTLTPAVDVYESEDSLTVEADMPGVSAEALRIDLREGVLTLRGESESGTYHRQFRLSDRIDQEKIDARLVDGVLTLKLPKIAAAKPRQIAVQTS